MDDPADTLQRLEKTARNMQSLSHYSRANQINRQWIEEYLNEAHSFGLIPVRCHCNVMSWADSRERLRNVKNDTGSALAQMGCKPGTIPWTRRPSTGRASPAGRVIFPLRSLSIRSSSRRHASSSGRRTMRPLPLPFGIKMADRLSGRPLHLDISDEPMRRGITTNRNKFILGPSGSGKSFFTNHLVRNYYEQGAHILLVDTGNSYKGLCRLIHERTRGEDGIYITYEEDRPITFNPFYSEDRQFDVEKRESIKTLILTLWKREDEVPKRSEEVALSGAVNAISAGLRKTRSSGRTSTGSTSSSVTTTAG